MKYGESTFDIIYLLFAITCGIFIIIKSKHKIGYLMGIATLVLGIGDSFHLIPRVLNYFIDKDFTIYLGIGKCITSITMTIFYMFMYYIYVLNYRARENKLVSAILWILCITRIILCLMPQNNWITDSSPFLWGIYRNIPFVILGLLITIYYHAERNRDSTFQWIFLWIFLSFLFYIPVVVGADKIPMLGMLMLPKTICYILIIISFLRKIKEI